MIKIKKNAIKLILDIMNKGYSVEYEIAGRFAMFARPDTGAAPISYPVPTWSACKAIFEAVTRGFFAPGIIPAAFFCPTTVKVGKPVRMEKYVINYRGPLRKSSQISKNASYQLPATILVDVAYQVQGICMRVPGVPDISHNAPHALKEMFERRLRQGKCKYAPCLGWKEFLPEYFGPTRKAVFELQTEYEEDIPGLLLSVWDAPSAGTYAPQFANCEVKGGVLNFPQVSLLNGKLVFNQIES